MHLLKWNSWNTFYSETCVVAQGIANYYQMLVIYIMIVKTYWMLKGLPLMQLFIGIRQSVSAMCQKTAYFTILDETFTIKYFIFWNQIILIYIMKRNVKTNLKHVLRTYYQVLDAWNYWIIIFKLEVILTVANQLWKVFIGW